MTWSWLGGFVLIGVQVWIFTALLSIRDELRKTRKAKEKEVKNDTEV